MGRLLPDDPRFRRRHRLRLRHSSDGCGAAGGFRRRGRLRHGKGPQRLRRHSRNVLSRPRRPLVDLGKGCRQRQALGRAGGPVHRSGHQRDLRAVHLSRQVLRRGLRHGHSRQDRLPDVLRRHVRVFRRFRKSSQRVVHRLHGEHEGGAFQDRPGLDDPAQGLRHPRVQLHPRGSQLVPRGPQAAFHGFRRIPGRHLRCPGRPHAHRRSSREALHVPRRAGREDQGRRLVATRHGRTSCRCCSCGARCRIPRRAYRPDPRSRRFGELAHGRDHSCN